MDCLFACLLFYAIATVFQLYHCCDLMYWVEKEKARAYTFTSYTIQAWYKRTWPLISKQKEIVNQFKRECQYQKPYGARICYVHGNINATCFPLKYLQILTFKRKVYLNQCKVDYKNQHKIDTVFRHLSRVLGSRTPRDR